MDEGKDLVNLLGGLLFAMFFFGVGYLFRKNPQIFLEENEFWKSCGIKIWPLVSPDSWVKSRAVWIPWVAFLLGFTMVVLSLLKYFHFLAR